MTNPGPPGPAGTPGPGAAEDPPALPDIDMGLPESGTQHATSTDFALPVDEPVVAGDPLGEALPGTPPPARPEAPLYDEVAARADAPMFGDSDTDTSAYGQVTEAHAAGPAGPLGAVKAFAAQRPAAFLGAALAVGFLLGRLLSGSDDEED